MFFFYIYFSLPFPFQNKENWKCLLASTNVSTLCLDFDEVSAILQALHIRALLSRSSGEMKFDSSSCIAFVKTMLEFFLQTTHFVKSRAHSPRPTSKIIAIWDAPFWWRQTLWWVSMHIACSAVAHAHAKKTPVWSTIIWKESFPFKVCQWLIWSQGTQA